MEKGKADVVVIGSGVGGMLSAALLTHAGYDVLMAEKMPHIGGRCSTLEYEGFKLFTGVAWMEARGVFRRAFEEVGAAFNVRAPDPQVAWRIGGKDVQRPPKGGFKSFFSMACRDENKATRLLKAVERAMKWAEPSDAISLEEWVAQYTDDAAVRGLFYAFVSDAGKTGAGEAFRSLKSIGEYHYGYPVGGCIDLMESLAGVIRGRCGRVWTRTRVKRILVENGKAAGIVVTRDGQDMEIRSGAVVSNAGPRTTVALAGKDRFDQGHLRDLKALCSIPIFSLHVVSDRPLIDSPALIFTPEIDAVDYFCCPTLTCPELAPPGRHMLVVGGTGKENFGGLLDHKKVLNTAVQELRENIPGFDRYGRILHAACYSRGWPALRSVQGQGMPRKTSIENLYDVGDGVVPPGTFGHVGCLAAARDVAADVKIRLKPGESHR